MSRPDDTRLADKLEAIAGDVSLGFHPDPEKAERWVAELFDAAAALRAAETRADLAERQLGAVDKALPPWESKRADGIAVGRVQTILNLKQDRGGRNPA